MSINNSKPPSGSMDTAPVKKLNRQEYVRIHSMRLPTPPPDPTQTSNSDIFDQANAIRKETIDKENEFLEYLSSLPVPSKDKPGLQRTGSVFAPVIAAEDAFDHLDKLYKVMEQLLNLREQNAKLQRRVRDLEHLRTLQTMHRHVASAVLSGEDGDLLDLDDDCMLAEAFLDNIFSPGRQKRSSKNKPTINHFRLGTQRNFSVVSEDLMKTTDHEPQLELPRNNSRKSLIDNLPFKKAAKVSKWTKVKAAFRWEKASPTVTGAKSQDSGLGGMLPVNNEVARYLRVPSAGDNPNETGTSPADSVLSGSSWQGAHGLSTPGTISPASSTDDLTPSAQTEHRSVSRTGSAGTCSNSRKRYGASPVSDEEGERRSRSLDYSSSFPSDTNHPIKEELIKLQASKVHKTPWGKVKDIIQTRKDSLRKKQHRLSARSDDCKTDWSAGSDQEDVFEAAKQEPEDSRPPTVTVTNTDDVFCTHQEKHSSASDIDRIPPSLLARYQHTDTEEDKCQIKLPESPKEERRVSKWTKVKKAFLTSASTSKTESDEIQSVPSSPSSKQSHFFCDNPQMCKDNTCYNKLPRRKISDDDSKSKKLQEEIYRSYEQLQKKLSLEFQEKLQEWEKVKASNSMNSTNANNQSSSLGCSSSDEQRDPEFVRKMEEWEKIKSTNESNKKKSMPITSEENLPADFKKKLQEWEKIKKQGVKEDASSKKKISEWQLWRSNSNQKHEINPQLGQPDGRQFSDDFLKKLDEWKQIKANRDNDRTNYEQQEHRKSLKENKTPSPGLSRKDSAGKLIRQSKKFKIQEDKELHWLEKELQKIDREKQRLEREREKFLEREERLAKLRRSVGTNPHKKDVLVQTSTGFFRFEGISRKFTQRLYEWEKARGIGPEDSTIALLNTGYRQIPPKEEEKEKNKLNSDVVPRIKLVRSKSMDSVANLSFGGAVITHQPSSLSLNDMEELEMQCLAESHSPSEQNIDESEDNLEDGEPEAMLVEVEDLIEETAAPFEERIEVTCHHTPVYQTETIKLCESEKCEAPQVRRSESARALSSYNLIQESIILINKVRMTEQACKKTEAKICMLNTSKNNTEEKQNEKSTGAIPKRTNKASSDTIKTLQNSLETQYIQQADLAHRLHTKLSLLQEANISVIKNASSDNSGYTISQLSDTTDIMQDLSAEIIQIAEKLKNIISKRIKECKHVVENTSNKYMEEIIDYADSLTSKLMELKRSLTYICAASDMTAPGRRKKGSNKERKFTYYRSLSSEAATADKPKVDGNSTDDEDEQTEKTKIKRKAKLVKSKSEDTHNSVKYNVIHSNYNRSERFNRENEFLNEIKKNQTKVLEKELNANVAKTIDKELESTVKHNKKIFRTRRISDGFVSYNKDIKEESENTEKNDDLKDNNIVIPTSAQYLDITNNDMIQTSPVSIFVHTTRKLFTPFVSNCLEEKVETEYISNYNNKPLHEDQSNQEESNEKVNPQLIQNNLVKHSSHSPTDSPLVSRKKVITISDNKIDNPESSADLNGLTEEQNGATLPPLHLPPLPNSPVAHRRERTVTKETSPAIRIMIARYNQKLSEQDSPGYKSGGSSGSASPVAWRSPVLERRVKTQSEKYQEEVNKSLLNNSKFSPHLPKKQVQKSASTGIIHPVRKQFTFPQKTERGNSLDSSNTIIASPKMVRGILKSSSVDSFKKKPSEDDHSGSKLQDPENKFLEKLPPLPSSVPIKEEPVIPSPVLQERAYKLQKAKEEFFQISQMLPPPTATRSMSINKSEDIKYPTRNRLSQVSFGSESSCDDMHYSGLLVKSASAGMINIEEAAYQQFRPEIHSEGYVSLPRSTKKKDGKFGISSITSKFRKVKMRRSKDPTQMNAVSALCRQSLVVDITLASQAAAEQSDRRNDEPQPSTSKTSWLKNPARIFKQK